jgi:hypothetical protein
MEKTHALRYRIAPLEMSPGEFRKAFISNAVIGETFVLRACIVNFRTSLEDIEAIPGIVIRIGREVDAALRPAKLKDLERNT